jgi:hypothetical protein
MSSFLDLARRSLASLISFSAVVSTGPVVARQDFLARLQSLVLLEEVLDFGLVVLVDVVDVLDVIETDVGGHAQHLVVAAGLVDHVVQADGAALDHAAREHGVR